MFHTQYHSPGKSKAVAGAITASATSCISCDCGSARSQTAPSIFVRATLHHPTGDIARFRGPTGAISRVATPTVTCLRALPLRLSRVGLRKGHDGCACLLISALLHTSDVEERQRKLQRQPLKSRLPSPDVADRALAKVYLAASVVSYRSKNRIETVSRARHHAGTRAELASRTIDCADV